MSLKKLALVSIVSAAMLGATAVQQHQRTGSTHRGARQTMVTETAINMEMAKVMEQALVTIRATNQETVMATAWLTSKVAIQATIPAMVMVWVTDQVMDQALVKQKALLTLA